MKYTVNGVEWSRERDFVQSYEDLVERARKRADRLYTVTFLRADGRSGELCPGQDMVVTDGTHINVADTSNA